LNLILFCLKRLLGTSVSVLRTRFVHWTTPLTSSLPLGTLTDLARSKAELIAEHALLRQQLIMLKRQVKRPACTKTDRILLVLWPPPSYLAHTYHFAPVKQSVVGKIHQEKKLS
jgi:hypothetical protein